MNANDDGREIDDWITRNRRSRGDFPPGDEGDRSFGEYQGKYAFAVQKILELPGVREAAKRFSEKNFDLVLSEDGSVRFVEKGVHRG